MDLEIAKRTWKLVDELLTAQNERHGVWKAMLPEDETRRRAEEHDKRIAELLREIDEL